MTSSSGRRHNTMLLTGALREPMELLATVSRAVDLRDDGLLDEIILSTWADDWAECSPTVRASIERDVKVITAKTLPDLGYGNVNAQFHTVLAGLSVCKPQSCVVRVRTDKTLKMIDSYRPLLAQGPPDAEAFGATLPLFKSKICIFSYAPSVFMWVSDFSYGGLREDLLRAVRTTRQFEDAYASTIFSPELRMLSHQTYLNFPFSEEVVRQFSPYVLSHAVSTWAARSQRDLPVSIARFYAIYCVVHASNFTCTLDLDARSSPATPNVPFRTLVGGDVPGYASRAFVAAYGATRANSSRVMIAALAEQDDEPEFRRAIRELREDAWHDWTFTPDDAAEVEQFCREMFGLAWPPAQAGRAFETHSRKVTKIESAPPGEGTDCAGPLEGCVAIAVQLLDKLEIKMDEGVVRSLVVELVDKPAVISAGLEAHLLWCCAIYFAFSECDEGGPFGRSTMILAWESAKRRTSEAQIYVCWAAAAEEGMRMLTELGLADDRQLDRLALDGAYKGFWPGLLTGAVAHYAAGKEDEAIRMLSDDVLSRHIQGPVASEFIRQLRAGETADPKALVRGVFPTLLSIVRELRIGNRIPPAVASRIALIERLEAGEDRLNVVDTVA